MFIPLAAMSEARFPSGQWTGFFTYSTRPGGRYPMDLILEFRDGMVSGEGADGIGPFSIRGSYSAAAGECSWLKTYPGSHAVDYVGYAENRSIWGTWTLLGTTGGFHIWPLGQEAPAETAAEEHQKPGTAEPPGPQKKRTRQSVPSDRTGKK